MHPNRSCSFINKDLQLTPSPIVAPILCSSYCSVFTFLWDQSLSMICSVRSSALNNLPPHVYRFSHISVMLSPGSPFKWQVQDSLSSTSSLLYSESDQTEDELEVFSYESEAAGVVPDPKTSSVANRSSQNSKSPFTFVNQRSGKNGQTGCISASPAYTGPRSTSSERFPTEGNLRFACKVSLKISSSYLKFIVLQVSFSQVAFHLFEFFIFFAVPFKRRSFHLWNAYHSWACSFSHRLAVMSNICPKYIISF